MSIGLSLAYVSLLGSPLPSSPLLYSPLLSPPVLSSPPVASSDDMTLTSPSMDNSSSELLPGSDSPLNKRVTETLLASLTEQERQGILSVPAAQSPEDLRMFAR